MPRKPRLLIEGQAAVYHVMSRTTLDGFVMGDAEKDYLLKLIRHLSAVYFAEILAFCLMGNHFHIVVRMHTDNSFSDENIRERFTRYYGENRTLTKGQIPLFRQKWASLSEFIKEIKQNFSRYYNKRHNRRGFFWAGRYKSVIVEEGDTLINCLAYVDLNPVRAGIIDRPDDYRWNSLGWHTQTGNRDNFLSLDFGLQDYDDMSRDKRLSQYRQFVYEVGCIKSGKGKNIDIKLVDAERKKGFSTTRVERFLARSRYFTDSGIIGSRAFIQGMWQQLRGQNNNPDKIPVRISGLSGIFSLKRLSENIP